jgi:ribonuclease HI
MISSNIKVLQINLNRNQSATESALQIAIELKVDLIIIQEPWIYTPDPDYNNSRSVQHPGFIQILPRNNKLRPRTLIYISKDFKPLVRLAASSPLDPDLLIIDITEGNHKIQLLNIYNETDQLNTGIYTLDRCLYSHEVYSSSIILGDFNTHHPWWDPLAQKSPRAEKLVEWLEQQNLTLQNTPGIGTFYRPNLVRESVLDLTFTTSLLASRFSDWQIIKDIGSDHFGILFSVSGTKTKLVESPLQSAGFNTKLANWDLFASTLKSNISECLVLNHLDLIPDIREQTDILENRDTVLTTQLDIAATELTEAITKAAKTSIPASKPGARPKPWWNPELLQLRKEMLKKQRENNRLGLKQPYLIARNTYFLAIKKAKRKHWNQFLEKEDSQSIFKAMSYTKDKRIEKIPPIKASTSSTSVDSFQEKCSVFRSILFPSPPQAPEPNWDKYRPNPEWKWPILTRDELDSACSTTKIKGKTPGPDQITQEIIQQAYQAVPDSFFRLYSSLIDTGYHPTCWRQATGAILKKPAKPDYSAPKAYRVISLLNCLGKVSERILAQRLGYLAETTPLLNPTQLGGRQKKSAIDTALLLTTEVESNKRLGRKTTALFLDIKGAFDHVAKNQLLAILQNLRLPYSLIAWVCCFLSNRTLRLAFDGQIEGFSKIDTGIPQGSPISPILFLIYIRDLFPRLATKVLSYIDDIALLVSSTSLKKNIRILEREVSKLYELGAENAIQFDLAKTELIHFTKVKEAKTASLKLPNNESVQPKELVRWLGIWFDPNLSFKEHVNIRASQARSVYQQMTRLANTERGLSPYALRQLYRACITSIADYGSVIWWRGQKQLEKPLIAIQNLALRKILGVFKTAPISALETEAALLPPRIRLDSNLQKYAFRLQKLSPEHPINKELALFEANEIELKEQGKKTFKGHLQIRLIKESCKGLVDLETLEPIKHFKFPPWDRSAPYKVNISQHSKEETTINFIKTSEIDQTTIRIYTDASYIPKKSQGIGVGLAIIAQNQTTYTQSSNIGLNQIVYNGELEGITQAIEYTSSIASPGDSFKVYSDNQASLYRLKTLSDNPGQIQQIRAIRAAKQLVESGAKIALEWIPGHMDIYGNELADRLAKTASIKLVPETNQTSFAVLGLEINKRIRQKWLNLLDSNSSPSYYKKTFPWKTRSKIQLPSGTKRELASSFYQLKIGHGYFKAYLNRFGHAQNDLCRCGKKETPEHLLLSCRDYKAARQDLKEELNSNRLNLPILLNTKIGIKKTLDFLKKTKVATRGWHTQRRREEEEVFED